MEPIYSNAGTSCEFQGISVTESSRDEVIEWLAKRVLSNNRKVYEEGKDEIIQAKITAMRTIVCDGRHGEAARNEFFESDAFRAQIETTQQSIISAFNSCLPDQLKEFSLEELQKVVSIFVGTAFSRFIEFEQKVLIRVPELETRSSLRVFNEIHASISGERLEPIAPEVPSESTGERGELILQFVDSVGKIRRGLQDEFLRLALSGIDRGQEDPEVIASIQDILRKVWDAISQEVCNLYAHDLSEVELADLEAFTEIVKSDGYRTYYTLILRTQHIALKSLSIGTTNFGAVSESLPTKAA